MWSQNVCRLKDSLLPLCLWPAGWWGAGKEGPAQPTLAADQVEAWQEGHANVAGSGGTCWRFQEYSAQ